MCLLGAGLHTLKLRGASSSRPGRLQKLLEQPADRPSVSSIIDDRLHDINETEDGENPRPVMIFTLMMDLRMVRTAQREKGQRQCFQEATRT